MEWKIGVSGGLATTVGADWANCHEIIPLSEFCSVLFVCFFSLKAEMRLLLNLFVILCFETVKLISITIFILATSHVRAQPSSLKQIRHCLLYWLRQEFHPALVQACLFCSRRMILQRSRFNYHKKNFPNIFYAEKILNESSKINNMHRSSEE